MIRAIIERVREVREAAALHDYLHKRTLKFEDSKLIERKSDGAWFTAGCPQDFGRCMAGMFSAKPRSHFHFYRVRVWRGLLIASRKTFWRPKDGSNFKVIGHRKTIFETGRLSERIENRRIDEMEAA